MAVGDKLVTLDGLKAVYQDVNGNIVDLKSAFENEIGRTQYWENITLVNNKYIDDDGIEKTNTGSAYTNEIPLTSGKYYISITKSSNTGTYRIHGYKNGSWVKMYYKGSSTATRIVDFEVDNDEVDAIVVSYYVSNTTIESISQYNVSVEKEIDDLRIELASKADAVVYNDINIFPNWLSGGVNFANGNATTTSYLVKTDYIYTENGATIETDDSENYWFRIAVFSSASVSGFDSAMTANDGNVQANKYIRIVAKKIDGSDPIAPLEIGHHISVKIKKQNAEQKSRYDHSPYKCRPEEYTDWYHCLVTQEQFEGYGFGRNKSYADTIALYDSLVDNKYVTKNLLDTITITGLGDVPIYEYVFSPVAYAGQADTSASRKQFRRTPKILLDGSMHGFEKGSTFGNYLFLYDLVNNWQDNKTLTNIRNYCEIRCIPISNPYGFENNTYANESNVNINRNFPCSTWEYEEPGAQGSGEEAGDQPETQLLMKWVYDNSDAMIYMAMHTNGQYYTSSYPEMQACLYPSAAYGDDYTHKMFNIFNRQIERQTLMWPEYYSEINPANTCGQYQATSKKGTVDVWALEHANTIAITLEGINGLKLSTDNENNPTIPLFSKTAMCVDAEITGNFIANLLNEYCR